MIEINKLALRFFNTILGVPDQDVAETDVSMDDPFFKKVLVI